MLPSRYHESRSVVQEAAKAAAEASFQEGGVLWRDVLRQQAPCGFTARLPICGETSVSNSCLFVVHPILSAELKLLKLLTESKQSTKEN